MATWAEVKTLRVQRTTRALTALGASTAARAVEMRKLVRATRRMREMRKVRIGAATEIGPIRTFPPNESNESDEGINSPESDGET